MATGRSRRTAPELFEGVASDLGIPRQLRFATTMLRTVREALWRRSFGDDILKAIGDVELHHRNLVLPPVLDRLLRNLENSGVVTEREGSYRTRVVGVAQIFASYESPKG